MTKEAWEEMIPEILSENGIVCTADQAQSIASAIFYLGESYPEVHNRNYIPSDSEKELKELKDQIEQMERISGMRVRKGKLYKTVTATVGNSHTNPVEIEVTDNEGGKR